MNVNLFFWNRISFLLCSLKSTWNIYFFRRWASTKTFPPFLKVSFSLSLSVVYLFNVFYFTVSVILNFGQPMKITLHSENINFQAFFLLSLAHSHYFQISFFQIAFAISSTGRCLFPILLSIATVLCSLFSISWFFVSQQTFSCHLCQSWTFQCFVLF